MKTTPLMRTFSMLSGSSVDKWMKHQGLSVQQNNLLLLNEVYKDYIRGQEHVFDQNPAFTNCINTMI